MEIIEFTASLLGSGRPAPVELVTPTDGSNDAAGPGLGLLRLTAFALGMLLLSIAIAIWVWLFRRWLTNGPLERAFCVAAWRLRLNRERRELVRRLAAAHEGAAPVALLLSRAAFNEAARRARRGANPPSEREIDALELAVFG